MKSQKIVIGILAHVDAGKTTLSEDILYFTGSIRKLGRVDHGNAFLDTDELERARGITIFSKQAQFQLEEKEMTLLDTPGHVDFSAEMERTLQVLDYAVLVINGADGVQSHTVTLWKLLKSYEIPLFLFVNKMDQIGTDRVKLLKELERRLDERCIDFSDAKEEGFLENVAMCSEDLMDEYVKTGDIRHNHIIRSIQERSIFPCYFGSALKATGVEEFLKGINHYTEFPDYPEEFGAKIYKITRDAQGNRLTHLKVTGGRLTVKALLTNRKENGDEADEHCWDEKVDQIRIYSGSQFRTVNEVMAGTVCAVTGLSKTHAGQGLGVEEASDLPILEPVLTYQVQFAAAVDMRIMLGKLRQLEEEEPQLHILWNEQLNEIHAQIMGEIEIEILKKIILERFGVVVEFGSGSIVYQETILEPVVGVGHFEPLRHYAEVHLLLEPGEPGSGLHFASRCSEDLLSRNWQRLILSHLEEKKHKGVLTGSEITDMKITLMAGKAHQKHTEGGDFRQATYRAVRQGLKKANSILLEPVYEFQLEVPMEAVGRALTDIQKMGGSFEPPKTEGETSIITGSAPASVMSNYQAEVTAYTKGLGRLFCTLKGYEPCCHAEEIIAEKGYESEKDLDNPTGSVFCAHGAGFTVAWDQVEAYMNVDSMVKFDEPGSDEAVKKVAVDTKKSPSGGYGDEGELEKIFLQTYGVSKRERDRIPKRIVLAKDVEYPTQRRRRPVQNTGEAYLLVDGYNIIFAWDELKELAAKNLDSARDRLIELLCNYQGYKGCQVIVVFDAYKVIGGQGSVMTYDGVHVIYTKEAETADQYIERTAHNMSQTYNVTVATSDRLVQMIIWGDGARRLSALELKEEIDGANEEIRALYAKYNKKSENYPFEKLGDVLADKEFPPVK